MKSSSYPLVRQKADTTLLLIREALKSRKLFETLSIIGLEDCPFQPHLDSLVLDCFVIENETDETFERYDQIMRKHSATLTAYTIMETAETVHDELMKLKRSKSQNH